MPLQRFAQPPCRQLRCKFHAVRAGAFIIRRQTSSHVPSSGRATVIATNLHTIPVSRGY